MIKRQGLLRTLVLLAISLGMATPLLGQEKADTKTETKPVATGTWKWTIAMRDGQTRESVVRLIQDGQKLTGVLLGRNNQETPIEDGQIKDGEVTFTVTREFNNQKFVSKYKGKLTGDTIKGTNDMDFNGQSRSREWEAKREQAIATGTWKWSFTRQDGTSMEFAVKLAQDGEKLTGVSLFNNNETAIEEGKITGKAVSFVVTRERNGNRFTTKFQGQIEGNTLKGKIQARWGDQDREFDWEAKRSKE
ncbi:MAG TPA: hypothetical protein VHP11_16875 [Tepidisphaeraceae bacterium]|nr:hypothetical protein [Tepidisphaeraceae bacterium]